MAQFHIDPLIRSENLRQKILSLEEQVAAKEGISFQTKSAFFQELESTCLEIAALKKEASAVGEFAQRQITSNLEELDGKIVSLYGRIHNFAVDHEVKMVHEKVRKLIHPTQLQNRSETAAAISPLKAQIRSLTQAHALGLENRQIIALAQTTIKRVDKYVKNTDALPPTSLMNQFNLLEVYRATIAEDLPTELDVLVELFEIAEHFYQRKDKEAFRSFQLLPEEVRNRVKKHLITLGIASGSPREDRGKSMQALIATSEELGTGAQMVSYLSYQELEKLFKEANSPDI